MESTIQTTNFEAVQVTVVPTDLKPLYVRLVDIFGTDPVQLSSVTVVSSADPSGTPRPLLPENAWRTFRINRQLNQPEEELAFVQLIDFFGGVPDLEDGQVFTYILEFEVVQPAEDLTITPQCGCEGAESLLLSWEGMAELYTVRVFGEGNRGRKFDDNDSDNELYPKASFFKKKRIHIYIYMRQVDVFAFNESVAVLEQDEFLAGSQFIQSTSVVINVLPETLEETVVVSVKAGTLTGFFESGVSVNVTLAELESACLSNTLDLEACPRLADFEPCVEGEDCTSLVCGESDDVSPGSDVCLPATCEDGVENGEV